MRDVAHDPVHAVAHEQLAFVGIKVHVRRALADRLGDDRAHELDGRAVVGDLLAHRHARGDLGLGIDLLVLDELGHTVAARQQRVEVLARDDDRHDVAVREHRDVVGREQVARVDQRDDQRAVVLEADRHGVEALHRILGNGVERAEVRLDGAEIDELQPEALRDRDAELVRAQDVVLEQELAHGPTRCARLVHGLLDGVAIAVAELDDDVAEQPAPTHAGLRLPRGLGVRGHLRADRRGGREA